MLNAPDDAHALTHRNRQARGKAAPRPSNKARWRRRAGSVSGSQFDVRRCSVLEPAQARWRANARSAAPARSRTNSRSIAPRPLRERNGVVRKRALFRLDRESAGDRAFARRSVRQARRSALSAAPDMAASTAAGLHLRDRTPPASAQPVWITGNIFGVVERCYKRRATHRWIRRGSGLAATSHQLNSDAFLIYYWIAENTKILVSAIVTAASTNAASNKSRARSGRRCCGRENAFEPSGGV